MKRSAPKKSPAGKALRKATFAVRCGQVLKSVQAFNPLDAARAAIREFAGESPGRVLQRQLLDGTIFVARQDEPCILTTEIETCLVTDDLIGVPWSPFLKERNMNQSVPRVSSDPAVIRENQKLAGLQSELDQARHDYDALRQSRQHSVNPTERMAAAVVAGENYRDARSAVSEQKGAEIYEKISVLTRAIDLQTDRLRAAESDAANSIAVAMRPELQKQFVNMVKAVARAAEAARDYQQVADEITMAGASAAAALGANCTLPSPIFHWLSTVERTGYDFPSWLREVRQFFPQA